MVQAGAAGGGAASFVLNDVADNVTANIDSSPVTGGAEIALAAVSAASVLGLSVGLFGGGGGGDEAGVAAGGAGDVASNRTRNRTKASISGGSTVTTTAGAPVTLHAA